MRGEVAFHGGDMASGNVFVIETRAPAGTMLEAHRHAHGHVSILAEGTARVTLDGAVEERTGPCVVIIPPNVEHKIEAMTDIVWYCNWAADVVDYEAARESVRVVEALNG